MNEKYHIMKRLGPQDSFGFLCGWSGWEEGDKFPFLVDVNYQLLRWVGVPDHDDRFTPILNMAECPPNVCPECFKVYRTQVWRKDMLSHLVGKKFVAWKPESQTDAQDALRAMVDILMDHRMHPNVISMTVKRAIDNYNFIDND